MLTAKHILAEPLVSEPNALEVEKLTRYNSNVKERRIRNAKFQVLTASFLRSEVLWGNMFCRLVSGS